MDRLLHKGEVSRDTRSRACLPTRSMMHYRLSRCRMWPSVRAATSERRDPQPQAKWPVSRGEEPRSTCRGNHQAHRYGKRLSPHKPEIRHQSKRVRRYGNRAAKGVVLTQGASGLRALQHLRHLQRVQLGCEILPAVRRVDNLLGAKPQSILGRFFRWVESPTLRLTSAGAELISVAAQ